MTETIDIVKNYTEAKDAYIDNVKSYIETILATNFCKHAQVSVKPNYITAELVNAYIYIDFVDDNNEHIFGSDINIRYTEKRPVDFEKLEPIEETLIPLRFIFSFNCWSSSSDNLEIFLPSTPRTSKYFIPNVANTSNCTSIIESISSENPLIFS